MGCVDEGRWWVRRMGARSAFGEDGKGTERGELQGMRGRGR